MIVFIRTLSGWEGDNMDATHGLIVDATTFKYHPEFLQQSKIEY